MAEGTGAFGRERDLGAAEAFPHAFAFDSSPDVAERGDVGGAEFLNGVDAGGAQAGVHVGADAGEIAEGEREEALRELGGFDDGEAVGFFEVGGDFGEPGIGGDADGAGEEFAGEAADGGFDFAGGGEGVAVVLPVGRERAPDLVDGPDLGDGQARLDGGDEFLVVADVDLGAGFDDGDAGAEPARFGDGRAHLDVAGLGIVAARDDAGGFGHDGDDGDGAGAQLGAFLLFAGGEEAVVVDDKRAQGHRWKIARFAGAVKCVRRAGGGDGAKAG